MNESVMLDLIITPLHEGVVTGIRDLTVAEDAVIAYPNPVNDRVHIHLAKLRAGAEVKVCDAQGKLLMTQRLIRQKPEIDLSGLRPGLLHIRVRNGKKLTTLSLIKLLKKDIDR